LKFSKKKLKKAVGRWARQTRKCLARRAEKEKSGWQTNAERKFGFDKKHSIRPAGTRASLESAKTKN